MKGKEYVRPVRTSMWLERKGYALFMARELTAVFVGAYAIFLLVLAYRASQGPEAFIAFAQGLKSPVSIILHVITLAAVLYHSLTWFDTGARVKALWRGEERVNPALLATAQYAGWIVVSVVVALVALSVARG